MRCPYCNGINADRASFCIHCGRDLTSPPQQPFSRQPPPYQPPSRSSATQRQQPAYSPAHSAPGMPPQPQQAPRVRQQNAPVAPPAPEAPAPFPPRTTAQLQTLEQGALPYTVMDTAVQSGRKKLVRITYPKCVPWQQVATLLKALKEQQETRFETLIIQGYLLQDSSIYAFTNGQLTFDRHVRLGSQIQDRYQIETGNGFESDSVRIVLSE
ncbi:MAG: hypothetical protein NVSMB33_16550 [Ktedonobacteraceae bacterium]